MAYKHRDIVIAWMDGAEVQSFDLLSGEWEEVTKCTNYMPSFYSEVEYRIKPKDKEYYLYDVESTGRISRWNHEIETAKSTIKVVVDGETNELKSVEIVRKGK